MCAAMNSPFPSDEWFSLIPVTHGHDVLSSSRCTCNIRCVNSVHSYVRIDVYTIFIYVVGPKYSPGQIFEYINTLLAKRIPPADSGFNFMPTGLLGCINCIDSINSAVFTVPLT